MGITPEQIEQSRRNIAEHKKEIARIRAMWDREPQLKVGDGRVSDLERQIIAEEVFLLKADPLG